MANVISSNLTNMPLTTPVVIEATTETSVGSAAQALPGSAIPGLPSAQFLPTGVAATGLLPVGALAPGLQPGALSPCAATTCSGVWTFRANGEVNVRCFSPLIRASSRVIVSASEYSSVWTNRFIGLAKVEVHNVAPFDGGMLIKVSIDWGAPIDIALSALIIF